MTYERYFLELYNVGFEITEEGTNLLAEKSLQSSSGARSVTPLVNDLMRSALADVEMDNKICKVILDGNGEECFICYEYGERVHAAMMQSESQLFEQPWYILRAKNTDTLVRKLCWYYRNTGAETNMLLQLEAFLGCAIPYLYNACCEDDFVFVSLEKLAQITDRKSGQAGFDKMIYRSSYVPSEKWENYNKQYTSWLCQNVKFELACILVYLQGMHGTNQIRFQIQRKKM